MMFYRRRASPKLHDDMTEVEYGGRGHRTRLRNDHEDQLVCHGVPPAPVYKGARGEAGRPLGRAIGGSPTPTGSRTPPFLVGIGEGKGEGERRKGAPPSLVQFGLVHGEGCGHPLGPFSPFPYGPLRPNTNSRNSPVLQKYSNHSEPFRCPNIVVQYIDFYVSAISRLLIMSPISSGTPNSFGTSKHITS